MTYSGTSPTYGDFTIELTFYTDGTGTFFGTATNEPTGNVTNASFSGSFALSGGTVTFILDDFTFDYFGTTVTCSSNVSATIN